MTLHCVMINVIGRELCEIWIPGPLRSNRKYVIILIVVSLLSKCMNTDKIQWLTIPGYNNIACYWVSTVRKTQIRVHGLVQVLC